MSEMCSNSLNRKAKSSRSGSTVWFAFTWGWYCHKAQESLLVRRTTDNQHEQLLKTIKTEKKSHLAHSDREPLKRFALVEQL